MTFLNFLWHILFSSSIDIVYFVKLKVTDTILVGRDSIFSVYHVFAALFQNRNKTTKNIDYGTVFIASLGELDFRDKLNFCIAVLEEISFETIRQLICSLK